MGGGRRPQPEKRLIAPVFEVVAAFFSGKGETGDLIPPQARLRQRVGRTLKGVDGRVFIRGMLPQDLLERQAFDVFKEIEGDMVGPEKPDGVQGPVPGTRRLARHAGHQVQAEGIKAGVPGPPDERNGSVGGRRAAEDAEDAVVKRLDADAQAGDAGPDPSAEPVRISSLSLFRPGGIGLQGEFEQLQGKTGGQVVLEAGDVAGIGQRRRSPAQIERVEDERRFVNGRARDGPAGAEQGRFRGDSFPPGFNPGPDFGRFRREAEKMAVRTLPAAEGEMDIEPGGRGLHAVTISRISSGESTM